MTSVLLVLLTLVPLAPGVPELEKTLKRHAKDPYEQRKRTDAIRDLGRIGTPESTRALERLLEDPFAHVRDAAVSGLIALKKRTATEREPSLELLGEFLRRRRTPETRRHLAVALGLIGDARAVPALSAALAKEKDPAVLAAICEALPRLRDEKAVPALKVKAGAVRGSAAARAPCLRALGWFPGTGDFVRGHAADPSDDVKAAAAEALHRLSEDVLPAHEASNADGERFGIALAESLPGVRDAARRRRRAAALVRHPSWRVRAAAIEGIAVLRDPTLLPDLVERLEKEPGRLRGDAWNALRRLTGKEIPPDPGQWRAILPLAELPDGTRDGDAFRARGFKTTSAYFELPIYSRRVAFVFDVSGSMRNDGKMEKAREQCAKALERLTPGYRYDLFAYRYLLKYPPRPKLARAFGKLVSGKFRAAGKWLGRQQAKGGGAIYDGLVAAMDDPEVDTIYLLSDGVPSYGTVSRDFRVLQEVRRRNRWRRVAIHTILLGSKGTDQRFMARLAAENGGIAVDGAGKPLPPPRSSRR